MNILITSGGTTESIDPVRAITNQATGRLGSLIAEQFKNENVFYLCSGQAAIPKIEAQVFTITDTRSLEETIRSVLTANNIDVIIHAMAVSDYRVKSVRSASGEELDRTQKISSDETELTIVMEQTPKVISILRKFAPNAVIVGFKLLDGVSDETLKVAAEKLLRKNDCDFVLANDKKNIQGDSHRGILIYKNGDIQIFETKQEIAAGIAKAVRNSD
jgi:phosphopantothenate-cysteine ligase